MLAPKFESNGDGLVLGEETLVWHIALGSDLDFERRVCVQIPYPLGVGSPGGADDHFAGLGVVGEWHRDRLVSFAALAALVGNQQEGVAEKPAEAVPVERARQPHEGKRDSPRLPAQPEQRPRVMLMSGRRAHDFVTGGLKIRDS